MQIKFILNDRDTVADVHPGRLVLDVLRRQQRLTGTKEGCKEGDCGACVVLIGEWMDNKVVYRPVTSCLMPVAELHGKHLVTVEGLNLAVLSPVQQAIVDEGATQCGFCTPGIVVSLTGYLMQDQLTIDLDGVKKALGGHLCRCTGYRSLKALMTHLQKALGSKTGIDHMIEAGFLPNYFQSIPKRLSALSEQVTSSVFSGNGDISTALAIAGGTDLYVQQGDDIPGKNVIALNHDPHLKGIYRKGNTLRIGAMTTFEAFQDDPEVRRILPDIGAYMHLIASWQIRNRATLGGNIVNASPIADMTIMLLALNASLILAGNSKERKVSLAQFYTGYKQMDLKAGEIVRVIEIAVPTPNTRYHFEKVSRRTTLDIATVNSAIAIQTDKLLIRNIRIAVGGVGPIPMLLNQTGDYLLERKLSIETVARALDIAQSEISPISDIRGSEHYKRLLMRQLLMLHFTTLFPEAFSAEALHSALTARA